MAILECMEEPEVFGHWNKDHKEGIQPLLYFYKELIRENLPTFLSERQKFDSIYFNTIKSKRLEEVCLLKLKRCLEQGQIKRFMELSKELSLKKVSQCPELIEGGMNLRSYLEQIQKIHEEGVVKETNYYPRLNHDKCLDWTYPLMVAANLDSPHSSQMIEKLTERLETQYDADLHRLLLKLASTLARKDMISPLKLGLHPLPEEIGMLSKTQLNPEELKVVLEKVAGMLDNPNAGKSEWLVLRLVLLKVLKLEKVELAKAMFRETFDVMRAKVWLKMHFKVDDTKFIYEVFKEKLWEQMFPADNPFNLEYKTLFNKISKIAKNHVKSDEREEPREEVPKSELKLSINNAKIQWNFHELLYKNVNLRREVGLFNSIQEDLLKFHVILKYLKENGQIEQNNIIVDPTRVVFSNCNFDLALKILRSEVHLPQMVSDNVTSGFNMVYEENPRVLIKHVSELLVFPLPQSHLTVLENIITCKWLTNIKDKFNGIKANNGGDTRSKKRTYVHLQLLRGKLNFAPFEKKVGKIKRHYKKYSEQWNIPKEVLRNATEQVEALVLKKPTTIVHSVSKVCGQDEFLEHSINLEEFFLNQFDPLLHYTKEV